ncbi:hypothetical protein B0H21DRAFT_21015 [Amylocystis lapponica]|nr:hypothetical protein B0H21DRAFT_21015 [Amylocystis lapponica]
MFWDAILTNCAYPLIFRAMPSLNSHWIRHRHYPHSKLDTNDETDTMEDDTGPNLNLRVAYVRSMPNIPMRPSPPRPSPVLRKKARSTSTSEWRSVSVAIDDKMQVKNEDALLHLKVEFHDKIHREYPVQEFVKHVWNFDENDHPDLHLKIESFIPHSVAVDMYNDAPNEVLCYRHLAAVTDALLTHLFPDPVVRAVQRGITFVQDDSVTGSFQPDLTWSSLPKPENPPWDWLLLFAEVKRDSAEKAPNAKKVLQGNVPEPTLKNLKRKGPDSMDEPPPKRRKQFAVSQHEAQTAQYLNEMLSRGIRSFASGFFVKGRLMHLWYGDRMGLVKSCAFDWQAKPALMALVFAALGTANLAQFGISPFLEFLQTSPEFNSYEGGHIVLPASEVLIGDSQERPSEDMVFKIDTTRRVWTDWGAIGRGTTIVPLQAIGAAAGRLGTEALVGKTAWLHASRTPEEKFICVVRSKLQQKAPSYLRHVVDLKCFVTRNMTEMGLPRAFMGIGLAEEDTRDFRLMVMKKYEPLESVDGVGEFKAVFEHVVRAHHWVWVTSGILHHDLSTSNIMFYRDTDGHAVGVLCDWDLAERELSDAEYQEDDHRLFHVPKQDPNVATDPLSTMKKQDDARQTIEGVDDAILEELPPRPRYRTGTGPFIALEILLKEEPPFHRYCHDLESLFYVLAYVCAVFDPEYHEFGRFRAWERNNFRDITSAKTMFFVTGVDYFQSTFDNCHEDYRPLVKEWVMPLWDLFANAVVERIHVLSLITRRNIAARMGREHIVAQRNEEIVLSVAAWRKTITYEAFMECLGLPPHLSTDPQRPSCDVP